MLNETSNEEKIKQIKYWKNKNPDIEFVKLIDLLPYREYNRKDSPKIDKLEADIKKDGLKQEIVLIYGEEDGNVKVGEGNHRIEVYRRNKKNATLPVRVIRQSSVPEGKKAPSKYKGEHVAGEFKPSEIGFSAMSPSSLLPMKENKFLNTYNEIMKDLK